MAKRTGGPKRKSRHKFKKKKSEKGKISIRRFFQELNPGDRVVLKAEPAYQKGMYHARFHGKPAIVQRKLKTCYEVKIKDGKKEKILIVHPVHLLKHSPAH